MITILTSLKSYLSDNWNIKITRFHHLSSTPTHVGGYGGIAFAVSIIHKQADRLLIELRNDKIGFKKSKTTLNSEITIMLPDGGELDDYYLKISETI